MDSNKAPDVIYLQWFDELAETEATWCQDRINETDVEYVKAESWPRAALEALEAVEWIKGQHAVCCPWCGCYNDIEDSYFEGIHAPNCPRQAAIAAARGEEKDKQ